MTLGGKVVCHPVLVKPEFTTLVMASLSVIPLLDPETLRDEACNIVEKKYLVLVFLNGANKHCYGPFLDEFTNDYTWKYELIPHHCGPIILTPC